MPDESLLSEDEASVLKSGLEQRLVWSKNFWRPLHERQDFWLNMHLLLDLVQQSKPLGFRRFVSNDPRTAVDSAQSILTRNDSYWQIDMPAGVIGKEEREKVGKIEWGLSGIVDDIDEMFLLRGEMPLWKQVAWFALMRGWVWGKFHVTTKALEKGRPSPMLAEMWDGRQVYPTFDGIGMANVMAEKYTTLAEMLLQYGDRIPDIDPDRVDLNAPAVKLEYWSNKRGEKEGVTGTLAIFDAGQSGSGIMSVPEDILRTGARLWLIPPYRHGLTPEQLPVVGVPVNGIPIKSKPFAGTLVDTSLKDRADRLGANPPSWHDPSGWVAESGRSLLAAVEEACPQYNELMATALQHFSIGTYPTWVFKTTSGELPMFQEGMNSRIPLHIGEEVMQFSPQPITADAWRLMEVLKDERQRGMLSNILQASSTQASGVLWQQVVHAALNALEPFSSGMVNFGSQVGGHILEQLKVAKTGPLDLVARTNRSYFRVEFDPKVDLQKRRYKPKPVFKPALPEDFLMKAQVARILLDPRRPIASVTTVLDRVLQWEDPEGEIQRMMADIANLDPVILLERVADMLEKEGEPELAARIRQEEFRSAWVKDYQFKQMQAQSEATAGPPPETGATTATGGLTGREGQGQPERTSGGIGVTGERAAP